MAEYKLKSYKTKKDVSEKDSVTNDPITGGPLEVVYDYEKLIKRFNSYIFEQTPIASLKYMDLYPIKDISKVVSLNEGGTPLYKSKKLKREYKIDNLYFKYEGANPTGAFKDRGTMVEVTKAVELGAKAIVLASTGNMAASVAAYSAKAGIPCFVFVPEGTPSSKLAQALAFKAKVIQVRGAYSDAAKLAEEVSAELGFFLAGDYCFRQEGQKSQAYEIIEQLRFKVPDFVVVPVGVGTNISAIWKGFVEYKLLGIIDKLPKMVAVQAAGASPIIKTFNLNLKEFDVFKQVNTVSGAIAVGDPLDGVKVIDLLRASKGFAIAIEDADTLEAQLELSNKESIFIEPSSATTIAAVKQLRKENKIGKNDTVVCVLTGNGLKDPATALKLLNAPPTIDNTLKAVKELLDSKILDRKRMKYIDGNQVVFEKLPSERDLVKTIKQMFDKDIPIEYIDQYLRFIKKFISKGKEVTGNDMKYIIDTVGQSKLKKKKDVIKLKDFNIQINKDKSPNAEIFLEIDGKVYSEKADGTGPVDASINAMMKILENNNKDKVKLTDYKVEINSKGTDAATEVTMKLKNEKGKISKGLGTSPDIIQASIDAFIAGYNSF